MQRHIISSIMVFFVACFGLNDLEAQRVIKLEAKPNAGQTKSFSASENGILPPQMLEGVEEYREFYPNPQLKSGSDIQVGDRMEIDLNYWDPVYGTVIAVNEYIDGVTGVRVKMDPGEFDFDFWYTYLAISDKGMSLVSYNANGGTPVKINRWNNKSYLLKYSQEYMKKRASSTCGADDSHIEDMIQEDSTTETIKSEFRIHPKTKSLPTYSFHDLEKEVALRVMYAYTTAAEESLTSQGRDLEHDATLSMLESQQALDNSKAGIRLEFVDIYKLEYEKTNLSIILNDAVKSNTAEMVKLNAARDAQDIDLVILATGQHKSTGGGSSVVGLANLLLSYSGNRKGLGFAAIDCDYTCGDFSVIHEIAHTLGCEHHKQQTTQSANCLFFKYSSAWRGLIDRYYVTLMGYAGAQDDVWNTYSRLPYFSSPDITLKGVTIGNAEPSNNTLVLKQTKHIASTYGKGMRIIVDKKSESYGTNGNLKLSVSKHDFELRPGDQVVYSRTPGDLPGTYETNAYIEDSEGNDVTDDPYYQSYIYIYSYPFEITPKRLSMPRILDKTYDGTTTAQLDFSGVLNGVINGDDVSINLNGYSVDFLSPNATKFYTSVKTTGTIQLTGSKAFCYEAVQIPEYYSVARIIPAPLAITAKNIEIDLGTDPATIDLTDAYSIAGLVNNETENVLSGTLNISIDPSITSSSPAGVYKGAIKIEGYSANNYEISYTYGDITIKGQGTEPEPTSDGLVTIGIGEPAAAGAILQLKTFPDIKDGSANANQGLLLPRVILTKLDKLYPMLEDGYDTEQDEIHIGLIVFNVNEDPIENLSIGVYVWNGDKWEKL